MDAKSNPWADMQAIMFPQRVLANAVVEAKSIASLLNLPSGAKILDLPCGLGRHSIELARVGFEVTAVDLTAGFLVEGKKKSAPLKLAIDWQEADMCTFCQPNTFDAVINIYTSFGYFKNREQDFAVLRNFYNSLKPGGQLLMDLMSRDLFERTMSPRNWREIDDGSLVLEEHTFTDDKSWLDSRWIVVSKENERKEIRSGLRLYTRGELTTLLLRAGFNNPLVYGDLDGNPYKENPRHLVLVAEKPNMP